MAGERRGRLLEAVVRAALQQITGAQQLTVAWDESREGLAIRPDLLISRTDGTLLASLLVTWDASRTDVKQKLWRDVGEIVDSACSFPALSFCSIRATHDFSGKEKAALFPLVSHSCIISDLRGGRALLDAIETTAATMPAKLTKVAAEEAAIALCNQHKSAISAIQADLRVLLGATRPITPELGAAAKRSTTLVAPAARKTYVKLAVAQLLLLDAQQRELLLRAPARLRKTQLPDLAVTCGTLAPRMAVAPSEVITKAAALLGDRLLLDLCERQESDVHPYREKLAHVAATKHVVTRLSAKPQALSKKASVLEALRNGSQDERRQMAVAFRTMVALKHGKQGAGLLDRMASHCNVLRPQLHGLILPALERGEPLAPQLMGGIAQAFSESLADTSTTDMLGWLSKVDEQVLYIFRTSLMSHGVDPLFVLIMDALRGLKPAPKEARIPAWLATRAAALTGVTFSANDLSTRAISVGQTIIHWKSAYEGHEVDKTKELAGRAFAMRNWSGTGQRAKLFLVIDGEFADGNLRTLLRGGWDDVFYADEMGRLVGQVV
jgi:hypothetical protein